MKKKLFAVMLSLLLILSFCCPAFAASELPFDQMVVDLADVLSDSEEQQLSETALQLTQDYQCAVYIVTIQSLEGSRAWEYNESLHREWEMGYGSEQSAVILLLALDERQYDIMAHGYGNTAFTDYGKEQMGERFIDEFIDDNWYGGFEEYLTCCGEYLQLAAEGTPYDVGNKEKSPVLGFLLGLGLPSAVASIVCSVFKGQMKTANKQYEARAYVTKEGLVLTKQEDVFTHITRTTSEVETKSKEGGTTVNSNGSSHSGGKF